MFASRKKHPKTPFPAGLVLLIIASLFLSGVAPAQATNSNSETRSDADKADDIPVVVVGSSQSIQTVINGLDQEAILVLEPGLYLENILIDKPLHIQCKAGAIIDGGGKKDSVRITASKVSLTGCTIRHWGDDLTAMDAGIVIKKTAHNVLIENNILQGTAFGVFLDGSQGTKVYGNKIQGDVDTRSQDRGNGIHLYAASDVDIAFNEVWETRDGIYIDTSNKNTIRNNEFHHLRYGVHYMYSFTNRVENNVTHDTRTGYALMQSKFLTVTNNRSENDENYGILMNFITHSTISGNRVSGASQGVNLAGGLIQGAEGKALFIYNSPFNHITDNTFERSDLGIHLTAGSESNVIAGNNFIGNQQQVKYVSNVLQEWSRDGRGNYWSDYLGWDRNDNGLGDIPYEPNDGIDKVLWKYPAAKVLMNSPAIETLRWIQREFPVLKSPGVTDSFPLMRQQQPHNAYSLDQTL